MVDPKGIEPSTLRMRTVRSPSWATSPYRYYIAEWPPFKANNLDYTIEMDLFIISRTGVLAQLEERYAGSVEVSGSNPLSSTI